MLYCYNSAWIDTTGDIVTLVVKNVPGVLLPSTGGKGTAAFLIAGITLSVTSGAVLSYLKKKKDPNA